MKKFKLIEETQYMLTDETRSDRQLNAVDLNLLAILQFIKDGKASNSDWFNVLIKHPNGKWNDDKYTSVEKYFKEFGVKTDYTTLNRSINKLQRLGYIEYKTGFYNNQTKSGQTPKIRLLRGTVNLKGNITDTYNDIAIAKEKENQKEKEKYNQNQNNPTCNISDFSEKSVDEFNDLPF